MEFISGLLVFAGIIGILTFVVLTLISLINKKGKTKKYLTGVGASFGALIIGFLILGIFVDTTPVEQAEEVSAEEVKGKEETEKVEAAPEEAKEEEVEEEVEAEEVVVEDPPQVKMLNAVLALIDEGKAFDAGSYIQGDIPIGEYAFIPFNGSGQYYSEEDQAGNILDNENFDSFGYVYVHEAGNLQTDGVLVSTSSFEALGVKGAKELYQILNDQPDYQGAGYYKVGTDIEPGQYVFESVGDGYVAVMTGPIGNSEIVDNENFNGRYSSNVQAGQYLTFSRASISE